MSDVEGDVPSAAPVEAAGPMGINEAIQEVLKQVKVVMQFTFAQEILPLRVLPLRWLFFPGFDR